MKNQYSETQLLQLVQDVEREFSAHLAKAEEDKSIPVIPEVEPVLAKAEDGEKKPEEKPEEKKPEGESKPEAKPEEKPEGESKPEGEPKPEGEAKPEGEEKPGMEAKPEGDLGHDYDDEDMQHMQKMYSSMSKGELKAHHDCIAELAKCGDMSQKQEQPIMKSEEIKPVEVKIEDAKPTQEVELLKSELGAANSKYDELKKNFDAVTAFLTKLVEKKVAPAPKAITSLDAITKSEGESEEKTLTKSEINEALTKKAQDPSLKKSDRDLINDFYLSGGSVKSINHLLK